MPFEEEKFEKPPIEKKGEFEPLTSKEIKALHESGCIDFHEGGLLSREFEELPKKEQDRLEGLFERRNLELKKLWGPLTEVINKGWYDELEEEAKEELKRAGEQFKKEFSELPAEEQNRRLLRELELTNLNRFKRFQESNKEKQERWLEVLRNIKLGRWEAVFNIEARTKGEK